MLPSQQMQPPQMQPSQQMPQMQPPQGGNYPSWGPAMPSRPMQPPAQMYDRPGQRPTSAPQGAPRKTPLKPWVLIVGALIMALLAFAVTRAFIHTAAPRTTAPDK